MVDNVGGWPDPNKPGVPLEPNRQGAHALRDKTGLTHILLWTNPWWAGTLTHFSRKPEEAAYVFDYLGPCHTPAEVATLVEAARREEREACLDIYETLEPILLDDELAGAGSYYRAIEARNNP